MRSDRGAATRSTPSLEPIRIEFYGPEGPASRPALDRPQPAPSNAASNRPGATLVGIGLVVTVAIGAVVMIGNVARDGHADLDPAEASPATPEVLAPVEFETLPAATPSTLPFPGGAVGPGRYGTDLLGLPIEFTIGEWTALRTGRPGTIVLTAVGTAANDLVGAPHVQFIRIAGWNTRTEAADRRFRGVGSIAPGDVETWMADNDLIVDGHRRITVDERSTEVYDIRVDPSSPLGDEICVLELRPCFWFASVAEEITPNAAIRLDYALYGPTVIRLWLIDIEGENPILVEAAAVAGDNSWFDDFEATTIATLAIGRSADGTP